MTIPCKRPKVDVVPHPSGVAGAWQGICRVPGCPAEPYNSVKTACEEFARRHRAEHRDAVPNHGIYGPTVSLNYRAWCSCDWMAADGCLTRTDNEASLAHHLSTEHGLVVCS